MRTVLPGVTVKVTSGAFGSTTVAFVAFVAFTGGTGVGSVTAAAAAISPTCLAYLSVLTTAPSAAALDTALAACVAATFVKSSVEWMASTVALPILAHFSWIIMFDRRTASFTASLIAAVAAEAADTDAETGSAGGITGVSEQI